MLASVIRELRAHVRGAELAVQPHEERLERERGVEVELLERPPRLPHRLRGLERLEPGEQLLALGAALRPAHALLGLARREVDPLDRLLLALLRLSSALVRGAEEDGRGVARLEAVVQVEERATSISASRRPAAAGSSSRRARSSRPAAARASANTSSSLR